MRKEFNTLERFADFDSVERVNFLDSDDILVPPYKRACFCFDYCLPDERCVMINGGKKGKSVRQVARKIYEYYLSVEDEMCGHSVEDLSLDTIVKTQNATKLSPAYYNVDFSS